MMHEHMENQYQILEGQKQNVQDNKILRRYMKWIIDKMGKMNGEKIFEMSMEKRIVRRYMKWIMEYVFLSLDQKFEHIDYLLR